MVSSGILVCPREDAGAPEEARDRYRGILTKEQSACADGAEMDMAKHSATTRKKGVQSPKKIRRSEVAAARMLIMAVINIIGLAALMAVRSEATRESAFVDKWLVPLDIVFGVLAAAALAFCAFVFVKKKGTSSWVVTPAMIFFTFAFCLLVCLLYTRIQTAAIVIASLTGTVLYCVYCLYMHVFYR